MHDIKSEQFKSLEYVIKTIRHFQVCASVSKRVQERNHSYENDFDLHENETACRTHFHMKGFALRLVLKQRHKRTWKWPVTHSSSLLP